MIDTFKGFSGFIGYFKASSADLDPKVVSPYSSRTLPRPIWLSGKPFTSWAISFPLCSSSFAGQAGVINLSIVRHHLHHGRLAQGLERDTDNVEVDGSIPSSPTIRLRSFMNETQELDLSGIKSGVAQLGEIVNALNAAEKSEETFFEVRAGIRDWIIQRIRRLTESKENAESAKGESFFGNAISQLETTLQAFDAGQDAFIPSHANATDGDGITIPASFERNTMDVIYS